jgi:hypothetical protein
MQYMSRYHVQNYWERGVPLAGDSPRQSNSQAGHLFLHKINDNMQYSYCDLKVHILLSVLLTIAQG